MMFRTAATIAGAFLTMGVALAEEGIVTISPTPATVTSACRQVAEAFADSGSLIDSWAVASDDGKTWQSTVSGARRDSGTFRINGGALVLTPQSNGIVAWFEAPTADIARKRREAFIAIVNACRGTATTPLPHLDTLTWEDQ